MLCIQCGEGLVCSGSIAASPSGTSVITAEVTPPLCPAPKPCGGDKSSPPPPGHKVATLLSGLQDKSLRIWERWSEEDV